MSISSLQSNEELAVLLLSNKQLVQEKKELHSKKLKTFTEKILKLGELQKLAKDKEESEYIQGKIKVLEERQNKEIAKLSNIEIIEREINSYIKTEGSAQHSSIMMESKRCNSAALVRDQLREIQPITEFNEDKLINFNKKGRSGNKQNKEQQRKQLKQITQGERQQMIKEERKLMERIDELEYYQAQLERNIATLEENFSQLQERIHAKQQSQLFLQSKLKSMERKIKEGEESINVNRSILSELESKLMLSVDKLNQAEANYNSYQESISELQQRRNEIDQSIIFYQRQTAIMLDSKHKLQQLIKQEKDYHSELTKMNQQYLSNNKLLSEQNSSLAQVITQKQEEISKLRQNQRIIKLEGEQLRTQIETLKKEIQGLQKQKGNKERLIKELNSQYEVENQEFTKLSEAKQEFQTVLRQIIAKKEKMMDEIEDQSGELSRIYNLLEQMKDSIEQCDQNLKRKNAQLEQASKTIEQYNITIRDTQQRIRQISGEVQEKMAEESNILQRLTKLKQVQTKMSINVSLKGGQPLCQGDIQKRIKQIVEQLSSLGELKSKLKECRYQNRKLKLQNERMAKQLSTDSAFI